MENAAEALKMAAAVLVFVGALAMSVMVFSQARTTSEAIIYTKDDTRYYSYVEGDEQIKANQTTTGRVVGLETIMPTLYRYYKEHYEVKFDLGSKGPLYTTKTNPNLWKESYTSEYGTSTKINSFDVSQEGARGEAWVGSLENYKRNLDNFLNGTGDYTGNGFIARFKNAKFEETIGKYPVDRRWNEEKQEYELYNPETSVEIDGEVFELVKSSKKRVITYKLIQ